MNHSPSAAHTATPQLRPVGTKGWLVVLPDLSSVMTWHAQLTCTPLRGQVEAIAAATTVLVLFATRADAQRARAELQNFTPAQRTASSSRNITIDVIYDGEDLAGVAEHLGISTEELIERHTQQQWTAAFGGFAPGFTYCVPLLGEETSSSTNDGGSFEWNIPRLETPRTAVPNGAVGLAGDFSAVYPRTSPGGWQLIGRTETPMWDTHADPPALLQPGDTVTYRSVRDQATVTSTHAPEETKRPSRPRTPSRPAFTVDNPGLQSLFQDSGRQGFGDMGVNRSGAADRSSAWVANDVLGNPSASAVIENIGGITLTATTDTVVCVTGALATVTVDAAEHDLATPVLVRAGATLTIQPTSEPGSGLRHYIAARGGFIAEQVLESSSSDVLSGLGPRPLEQGDSLSIGRRTATASVGAAGSNPLRTTGELRCIPGPRDDWFSRQEFERFCSTDWIVTGQSNRVGLRLALPDEDESGVDNKNTPLERSHEGELASEGMVAGCVQVPPSGLPVVFLADHPVTGGYPVIATVLEEDLDIAAQLAPGQTVRFTALNPETPEN